MTDTFTVTTKATIRLSYDDAHNITRQYLNDLCSNWYIDGGNVCDEMGLPVRKATKLEKALVLILDNFSELRNVGK